MLSKRGSISMSSQKRQSMYKRGGSISNLQDVVVDLTLDGDMSSSPSTGAGLPNIDHLNLQIAQLRAELASRPTDAELDSMRKEWETSEQLFTQSQKDNEQKHATIEHQRAYIKALEAKLEELLGRGWQDCVPNLPPTPAPAAFAPSRPFPRPAQGQAQQASSISQSQPQSQAQAQAQRASKRASISRNSGLADAARLRELRDLPTDKTTPAAALRRLQGEAPVTTPDISLSSLSSLSLSVLSSTPSPAPLPAPELARSGRTLSCSTVDAAEIDALMDGSEEGSAGAGSPPTVLKGTGAEQKSQQQQKEQADSAALAEQIAQLAQLVQALPRSVAQGVSAQQAAQAKTHTQAQSQAQTRDRARIEEQKAAMLEMLATAEKRADAREMRLQGMLADAKASSGQLGW